ncbi:HAMP domain-containing histidine kinase [Ferrovibrio terrae]|uniref:histidine kinase n=1 Tax=Ferrovibrio terrae TaxID=2594003 RepID=A0A516H5T6_9PROT|nr:HAMP domain-containing sensor histidine kinase [Ferrovibrio terrae]QDO99128.1 HAMP domain-containing histidine kinase [Ferrovibrio terrae]
MLFAATRQQPRLLRYLHAANRWLGRCHVALATAILVGFCALGTQILLVLCGEIFAQPLNGKMFTICGIITILVATPVILHAQMMLRAQRTARYRLKMMTRELAIALHNAEDVNNSRAAQFANMSHELRTPMNAIVGFSDILRHQRFGPMQNARYLEFAGDINDSAQHLLDLINNLLDLAKLEAGGFDARDAEAIEVEDGIEMAIRLLRPLATQQQVQVKVEIATPGLHIMAIERMLRQILINLLSNAIKFTPPQGQVTVMLSSNAAGEAVVEIGDTGIGMSATDIRAAFMPFGQVNSMLSRKHVGTGLGLPLAKAMVELNHGRLDLHSVPGEGTTVTLVFPALTPGRAEPLRLEELAARAEEVL